MDSNLKALYYPHAITCNYKSSVATPELMNRNVWAIYLSNYIGNYLLDTLSHHRKHQSTFAIQHKDVIKISCP